MGTTATKEKNVAIPDFFQEGNWGWSWQEVIGNNRGIRQESPHWPDFFTKMQQKPGINAVNLKFKFP